MLKYTIAYRVLEVRFQEAAIAALARQAQILPTGQQRKKHASLQEKIQGLWSTSKLFEKSLQCFKGMLCDSAIMFTLRLTLVIFAQIQMLSLRCPNICCKHCVLI